MDVDHRAVAKKAFIRLVPLLFFCYILAYLDRINVGFAALTMNKDIGLTAYIFGLGAGMFFIGYFFFEVPSNLLLHRFGARRWIARIMVSWGVVAMAMVFVAGPTSFLVMRFLIGVAEAGFFPGVILYLTYWFTAAYRARIIGTFMVAIPLSLALGAPISTAILGLNGILGLAGWQWLYLLEGGPTIVMAVVIWFVLPDRPHDAKWLSPVERIWLQQTIDAEQHEVRTAHGVSLARMFADWRVWGLSFVYFANTATNLGLAFFLPQILKGLGLSTMQVGLYTAIPYTIGTAGILVWGYVSDRMHERRINLALALTLTGFGLIGAGLLGGSLISIALFSAAAIGIYGAKAPFWPLPSMFLSGSAAAAGIAMINALGNLGGFAGPYIVGWIKDSTGSFDAGLYALSAFGFAAAAATLVVVRPGPRHRPVVSGVEP